VPDFGAATSGLLRETATAAPQLETVLDTFLRELGGCRTSRPCSCSTISTWSTTRPTSVDPARAARTWPRTDVVRLREPARAADPLARLRALGEVAELGTDDLRFDAAETARLFSETYEMRLEPAVLAELSRRTEGWAASLQLVRAAIHDRDPAQVRAFISSLSGAEGHLYDYLAEEVVGELPAGTAAFLMRTRSWKRRPRARPRRRRHRRPPRLACSLKTGERHGLFGRAARTRGTLSARTRWSAASSRIDCECQSVTMA
jgi:hypothetical protein